MQLIYILYITGTLADLFGKQFDNKRLKVFNNIMSSQESEPGMKPVDSLQILKTYDDKFTGHFHNSFPSVSSSSQSATTSTNISTSAHEDQPQNLEVTAVLPTKCGKFII